MHATSRVFIASTVAALWVGLAEGVARSFAAGATGAAKETWAVVSGGALLLGAIVGLLLVLAVAAASVRGPAHGIGAGAVVRLAKAPWWAILLGLAAFGAPLAVAIPIRAILLPKGAWITAIADAAALAIGWTLACLVARRFGERPGRRLSARVGGALFGAAGVGATLVGIRLRPGLVSADLWDLFLFAEFSLLFAGVAFLLPGGRRVVRAAVAVAALAILGGAFALVRLDSDARIREEAAADWRPATWIVGVATAIVDFDRDGFSPLFGGGDCDDRRDDVNPDGLEIAGNGIDENCRDGDREAVPPWPPRPTFVPLTGGLKEPRSVVIVVMDALRRDHLGVYGYEKPTSPNIDAFAAKAVRFDRAYSSAPTTRIALPVLFTGRTLGEIPWDRRVYPYAVRDSVETLPEILKKERGFTSAAFVTHRNMTHQWGWVQGFDEVNEKYVLPRTEYESVATGEGLAAEITTWIAAHRDERFLVYAHFLDPHSQYLSHPEGPDFGSDLVGRYDSEVWYTDKWVGTVLAQLDALGIADETMVVLMADHGELFGENGRKDHGGNVWEGAARIPLLVRAPGLAPGATDCLAGHVDLAPTILNLVGVDGGERGMSGATLVPDLAGGSCPKDREIVLEMRYGRLSAPSLTALVGSRHKLIMNNSLRSFSLYDLERDPDELHNVARAEPEVFEGMKRRLLAWTEVYANRELADIVARQTSAEPPAGAEPTDAAFENGVELVAIDFGARRVSPDLIPDLQLYLRTAERVRDECEVVFSLVDGEGELRFEAKHPFVTGSFPLRQWPLRRIVNDGFAFELRTKQMRNGRLKPGSYDARLGLECEGGPARAVRGDVDREGRVKVGRFEVLRKGAEKGSGEERGDGPGE